MWLAYKRNLLMVSSVSLSSLPSMPDRSKGTMTIFRSLPSPVSGVISPMGMILGALLELPEKLIRLRSISTLSLTENTLLPFWEYLCTRTRHG